MIDLKKLREGANHFAAVGNEQMHLSPQSVLELLDMLEEAQKDARRLDGLEEIAKKSITGVSVDYRNHVEDGCVIERGFRVMRHRKLFELKKTLREAIDAAMQSKDAA